MIPVRPAGVARCDPDQARFHKGSVQPRDVGISQPGESSDPPHTRVAVAVIVSVLGVAQHQVTGLMR